MSTKKEVLQFVRFFVPIAAFVVVILRAMGISTRYIGTFMTWQAHTLHLPVVTRLALLTADLYLCWALFATIVGFCMRPSMKRRLIIANGAFVAGLLPAIFGLLLVICAFLMFNGEVSPDEYGSGWITLAYAVVLILPGSIAFCVALQTDLDLQRAKILGQGSLQ